MPQKNSMKIWIRIEDHWYKRFLTENQRHCWLLFLLTKDLLEDMRKETYLPCWSVCSFLKVLCEHTLVQEFCTVGLFLLFLATLKYGCLIAARKLGRCLNASFSEWTNNSATRFHKDGWVFGIGPRGISSFHLQTDLWQFQNSQRLQKMVTWNLHFQGVEYWQQLADT